MAQVDILLATYNGERFIETQLLSIISQSYKDWKLLIHDDGSSDATLQIIKKWMVVDSRIILLEDGIICAGAAANFMFLLEFVTAPYIMFCDQDDLWFDNKVEVMLRTIETKDNQKPQVVYSNSFVWKPDSAEINGLATQTFPHKLQQFLFLNSGMQGCVAIFNRQLKEKLMQWRGSCAMHDHLLHLMALCMGEVTYLPLTLMLYRNHDRNVTGNTVTNINDIERLIENRGLSVVSGKHYDSVEKFLEIYHGQISIENARVIRQYLALKNISFPVRVYKVISGGFSLYNSIFRLVVKIVIRPYWTDV